MKNIKFILHKPINVKNRDNWSIKIITLGILIFMCNMASIAQITDSTNNYFYIVEQQDAYYDSLILENGADSMQSTGFKQYQRWKNFVGPRVDEDGDLSNYIEAVNSYYLATNPVASDYDWSYFGPKGLPDPEGTSGMGKGWVHCLLVDENPNIIYAGTHNSGLWKTEDGGLNWYLLTGNYPKITGVTSIIRSGDTEGTIYLATVANITMYSNGIFKSTDNGNTWDEVVVDLVTNGEPDAYPTTYVNNIPRKIIEHPSDPEILFLLTECNLYKSIDKGLNWTEVLSDDISPLYWEQQRMSDIIFDNRDEDNITMYLGGYKILKSTDGGGEDWTDITTNVTGEDELSFCKMYNYKGIDNAHANSGDVWFFCGKLTGEDYVITKYDYSDDEPFHILKFWNNPNFIAHGLRNSLIVDPLNENRIIYAGLTIKALRYNQNTGLWDKYSISQRQHSVGDVDSYIHADIRDLYLYRQGDEDRLIVACDGGVSKGYLQEGIEDWAFTDISVYGDIRETDLNINEVYSLTTSNQTEDLIFNCQDVGGYRLKQNDIIRTQGGDGGGVLIDDTDPGYYYQVDYQAGAIKSYDRNGNWIIGSELGQGLGAGESAPFYPIVKHPDNSDIMFSGKKIFRKFIDVYISGENQEITLPIISNCSIANYENLITDIEISKTNPDLMFVSTDRKYFWNDKDSDCGTTPPNPNNYENSFLKTVDGGITWTDLSPNILGLKKGHIESIKIDPNFDNIDNKNIWLCFGNATSDSDNQTTKKVYKSTDGGLSFSAFAQGIPPAIPVWDMEYDEYTDLLYVATDLGVFSRPADDDNSEWLNISTQGDTHPITMVYDIEINYRKSMLYAGTFGRGIWEASLGDCPDYDGINPETISADEVWNTAHSINSDLIVEAGATLTIKDIVYFHSESRLIIKPGDGVDAAGHLILDGGILTSGCDGATWKGVEVWGNGYQDQNPFTHGWLTMINNGTISNAEIGILASSSDPANGAFDYNGGIIHVGNSNFINNKIAIRLENFHFVTFNQFNNCKFITDVNWPHAGKKPEAFISFYNYAYSEQPDGRSTPQEIKGCSFENFHLDWFDEDDRGAGVSAFNTWLIVDDLTMNDPNTWYKPSVFKNLSVGVEAMGDINMLPVKVSNSQFVDNLNGINLNFIYNAEITLNDFEVDDYHHAHGLYLYNCLEGYHVEANVFHADDQLFQKNYGVVVHESGASINLIYNNSFSGLYYASAAQGINYDTKIGATAGLEFKCNNYTNNWTDIAVLKEEGSTDPFGIAAFQGHDPDPNPSPFTEPDYTALAGNIFTDKSVYSLHDWDLFNELDANWFTYHFHDPDAAIVKTAPVVDLSYKATGYPRSLDLIGFEDYAYEKEVSCPSTIENGGSGGTEIKSEMMSYDYSADSTQTEINELKDGGDTESLNFDTETAMPSEALETRDMLIAESPNLSDSVMVAAVENEATLPNVMVRDVLVENPQAAKSAEVQTALDNKTNTMPEYMREDIDLSGDTLSALEVKYSQLAVFRLKEQLAFNNLQHTYRLDTNIINLKDSLVSLYGLKGGVFNEYRKAMLFLSATDTVAMDSIIDNLVYNYELSEEEENERQSYIDYTTIKKRIISDSLVYPDSLALDDFADIYNNGFGAPVNMAANKLAHAGWIDIVLPHYQIDTTSLKSGNVGDKPGFEPEASNDEDWLIVKPNPAADYFIVQYKLPLRSKKSSIIVSSIDNRSRILIELHNSRDEIVVNAKDMKAGIYLVTLSSGTEVLQSKKLSIVK